MEMKKQKETENKGMKIIYFIHLSKELEEVQLLYK